MAVRISCTFVIGIVSFLLTILGCAGLPPKHEYTLAPGQGHHPGLAKAMIVPINESAAVPAGLDVADDRLEELLDAYLQSKGISVERPATRDYRRASKIAVKRARADAMSGESGTASETVGFEQIVPHLLEELEVEADLVIVPNVAMRGGNYSGGRSVKWDGVRRMETGAFNVIMTGEGLPVASIFVVVYGSDGTRVFSGYGDLDTIFEVSMSQRKYVLREDRLTREKYLQEGICVAFYPFYGEEERC